MNSSRMKLTLLRYVLMIDAAVLILLGVFFLLTPKHIESAFHFPDLPAAVDYLIALWGCVFLTLGFGYVIAATNPLKHVVWVQMGIARGALELLLGLVYLGRGVILWQQAAFGIVVAALVAIAYLVLYPRRVSQPAPAV